MKRQSKNQCGYVDFNCVKLPKIPLVLFICDSNLYSDSNLVRINNYNFFNLPTQFLGIVNLAPILELEKLLQNADIEDNFCHYAYSPVYLLNLINLWENIKNYYSLGTDLLCYASNSILKPGILLPITKSPYLPSPHIVPPILPTPYTPICLEFRIYLLESDPNNFYVAPGTAYMLGCLLLSLIKFTKLKFKLPLNNLIVYIKYKVDLPVACDLCPVSCADSRLIASILCKLSVILKLGLKAQVIGSISKSQGYKILQTQCGPINLGYYIVVPPFHQFINLSPCLYLKITAQFTSDSKTLYEVGLEEGTVSILKCNLLELLVSISACKLGIFNLTLKSLVYIAYRILLPKCPLLLIDICKHTKLLVKPLASALRVIFPLLWLKVLDEDYTLKLKGTKLIGSVRVLSNSLCLNYKALHIQQNLCGTVDLGQYIPMPLPPYLGLSICSGFKITALAIGLLPDGKYKGKYKVYVTSGTARMGGCLELSCSSISVSISGELSDDGRHNTVPSIVYLKYAVRENVELPLSLYRYKLVVKTLVALAITYFDLVTAYDYLCLIGTPLTENPGYTHFGTHILGTINPIGLDSDCPIDVLLHVNQTQCSPIYLGLHLLDIQPFISICLNLKILATVNLENPLTYNVTISPGSILYPGLDTSTVEFKLTTEFTDLDKNYVFYVNYKIVTKDKLLLLLKQQQLLLLLLVKTSLELIGGITYGEIVLINNKGVLVPEGYSILRQGTCVLGTVKINSDLDLEANSKLSKGDIVVNQTQCGDILLGIYPYLDNIIDNIQDIKDLSLSSFIFKIDQLSLSSIYLYISSFFFNNIQNYLSNIQNYYSNIIQYISGILIKVLSPECSNGFQISVDLEGNASITGGQLIKGDQTLSVSGISSTAPCSFFLNYTVDNTGCITSAEISTQSSGKSIALGSVSIVALTNKHAPLDNKKQYSIAQGACSPVDISDWTDLIPADLDTKLTVLVKDSEGLKWLPVELC